MSDNSQPSSARAVVNSATGTVREGVASVTGNPYDQAAADKKKGTSRPSNKSNVCVEESQNEWDASHATAKLGPVTASSSGAVHVDNEDRRQGQWKETVGSAKESVGSLIGNKDLQQSGRDQSKEGQAQSAIGQATDWIQGSVDRLRGTYQIP
jgi:uncharacterized protein YjbJ (UPF0337 family)